MIVTDQITEQKQCYMFFMSKKSLLSLAMHRQYELDVHNNADNTFLVVGVTLNCPTQFFSSGHKMYFSKIEMLDTFRLILNDLRSIYQLAIIYTVASDKLFSGIKQNQTT